MGVGDEQASDMETTADAQPARGLTIKGYVALWVGSVAVSFVALAATWYVTQPQLRAVRQRSLAEARALDNGRVLMSAILTAAREDLLWQTTGDNAHVERKLAALRDAEEVADRLETRGVSPDEAQLAADLQTAVRAFRAGAVAGPLRSLDATRPKTDDVVPLVGRYMKKNDSDLQDAMRAAERLRTRVDKAFLAVVAFVLLALVVGALGLIRRVVRPAIELTRAAKRLGRGDFAARARAERDDELGGLCRTFNAMADDLAAQEKARMEFVATVAHDLKISLRTVEMHRARIMAKMQTRNLATLVRMAIDAGLPLGPDRKL